MKEEILGQIARLQPRAPVMARVLSVRNWAKFQHYKDRDPPWIKLHRDILTSDSWVLGSDTAKLVQVASTLLAVRYSNSIPLNFELWKGVLNLKCTEADFTQAIHYLHRHKFIDINELPDETESVEQSASNVLATCASEAEAEAETETETDQACPKSLGSAELVLVPIDPPAKPKPPLEYTADFETFWHAYPRRVGKLAASKAYRIACVRLGEGALTRVLLPAVLRLVEAVRGKEPRFTPHPSTWLSEGRWDDDPAPPTGPTGRSQFGMGG